MKPNRRLIGRVQVSGPRVSAVAAGEAVVVDVAAAEDGKAEAVATIFATMHASLASRAGRPQSFKMMESFANYENELGGLPCHEAGQHSTSARKSKRASRNNGKKPSAAPSAVRKNQRAARAPWTKWMSYGNMPKSRPLCST